MAAKSQQNRERRILQFDAIAKLGTVLRPVGSACLSSGTFVRCAATAKRIVAPFHRLVASLVIIIARRRWVQNGQNNSGVPRFASERTLRKIQALLLPIELPYLQDSRTVFFFSKNFLCNGVDRLPSRQGAGLGDQQVAGSNPGRRGLSRCRVQPCMGVNLVQNVGGRPVQGVWGTKSPEAEAILDFYMHNFDLILNYFCFARATSGWLMLRNGSCLSMK